MNTQKKYTVITGTSSGIGAAVATAFAKRRKNLIIIARRKDRLWELKNDLLTLYPELDIVVKVCDLSITDNVYGLYKSLAHYQIETWINNAGSGNYGSIENQNLQKTETMLRLNMEALTILSSLYVRDYKNVEGTQLINLSSRGGYLLVPNAVTYCATKFFVSAFTEGLAHELRAAGAKLQAKVLAPSATKTEFGKVANGVSEYDYDKSFAAYHTDTQMAGFLLSLYDNSQTVGIINQDTFEFELLPPIFHYAGNSSYNQIITAND